MVAVELPYDGAAPGQAADESRAERERFDQVGEAIGVVGEAEARRQIGGAAGPRLVPGDHRELVGQRGDPAPTRW